MAKYECDYFKLVWVHVRPVPRWDNDNLIGRFIEWQVKNNVHPIITMSSGAGAFYGGFDPEDAPFAVQWLNDNGVNFTPNSTL